MYEIYPEAPEGELSKIRSILVSDAILAQIAIQIGVDKLLKLGPSEEKQGGRKRESNIACALEALLGAYYLNGKQTGTLIAVLIFFRKEIFEILKALY